MKKVAGGKQMKSVWTIPPPELWEKRFGKHPTQKPVALLGRILLAASNEGDIVLDPFAGSGTTLVAAIRLRRLTIGVERDANCADLAQRRALAELVEVTLIVGAQKDIDPRCASVDRSVVRSTTRMPLAPQLRLVREEGMFYFVGTLQREVIYSASAISMEQAWEKFRASPEGALEVFCVIRTQTEIYLAQGA